MARCIREERNFRFHLCIAPLPIWLAARYFSFTSLHWAILLLAIFGVLAFEAMNSAIERAVGLPDARHDALAGYAKDMAAGAVLVFCIGAVGVGVALFWQPDRFLFLWQDLMSHPAYFVLLGAYVVLSACFVFRKTED